MIVVECCFFPPSPSRSVLRHTYDRLLYAHCWQNDLLLPGLSRPITRRCAMPFDIQRVLAWAGLLCACSTVHCQAVDLPVSQARQLSPIQGWTEQDRQGWYHTSAGTQLIPYDWFIALEDEPLRNSFTRTGILVDPTHPDRLPIGFSKTEGPNVSEPQVGLTCAFCHTTQFTYQGKPDSHRRRALPAIQPTLPADLPGKSG